MGKKVIYTGKGGTEYHKNIANQYLLVGNRYTVEREIVYDWHTDVYLEEIHNIFPSGNRISFNSVMFKEENEEESTAEFVERTRPSVEELMDRIKRYEPASSVKNQIEQQQRIIKQAKETIAEIRKTCQHVNTFEGIWEWAAGHQIHAVICSDCWNFVKESTT